MFHNVQSSESLDLLTSNTVTHVALDVTHVLAQLTIALVATLIS